jgi:NADPH:quinone reductase-like Zn-dependent oxidoreductase
VVWPNANKLLGWDAAGIVTTVGSEVKLFAPGDEVYYAGPVDRSGSYSRACKFVCCLKKNDLAHI